MEQNEIIEVEAALNLARAELLSCYERLGFSGSNVLDIVTETLDKIQTKLNTQPPTP